MKRSVKAAVAVALVIALGGLTAYTAFYGTPASEIQSASAVDYEASETLAAELASEAAGYAADFSDAVSITLSDNGSTFSGSGVSVSGNTVTITAGGVYVVSGTLSEGQLRIEDNIQTNSVILILNGASISNTSDAALYAADCKALLLYLAEGTENTFTSGAETEITAKDEASEDASGAAVYAKDDLYIAGEGALNANGYINNAIASTDVLVVLSGTIDANAVNNGLKGKDAAVINGGTISITAGNDGIKSNNTDGEGCGVVILNGGDITINSYGDGVQAESALTVNGGDITVYTGGLTSADSLSAAGGQGFGDMGSMNSAEQGDMPSEIASGSEAAAGSGMEAPTDMASSGAEDLPSDLPSESDAPESMSAEASAETIPSAPESMPSGDSVTLSTDSSGRTGFASDTSFSKSSGKGGGMQMQGGIGGFGDAWSQSSSDINSSAKGLKCGGTLTVNGGTITIVSSDDALHADDTVVINDGELQLAAEDDGIHADNETDINGGTITIAASYEGVEGHLIYVTGGSVSVTASDDGFNASGSIIVSMPVLEISGGNVYVLAGGDGLDSNGDLIISGGEVVVDGPADSANGALDSGTESGGDLIVNGGTVLAVGSSGMAESFDSDSAQASINAGVSGQAGSEIVITASDGTVLYSHTAAKAFAYINFSCAALTDGDTVTISVDGTETDVTVGTASSSGGMQFGGGMGGHSNGNRRGSS